MSRLTIQEMYVPDDDVAMVAWPQGCEVIGNYVENKPTGVLDGNGVSKTETKLVVVLKFDPDAPVETKTLGKVKCGMVLSPEPDVEVRHLCTWYNPLSKEHVALMMFTRQAGNDLPAIAGEITERHEVPTT